MAWDGERDVGVDKAVGVDAGSHDGGQEVVCVQKVGEEISSRDSGDRKCVDTDGVGSAGVDAVRIGGNGSVAEKWVGTWRDRGVGYDRGVAGAGRCEGVHSLRPVVRNGATVWIGPNHARNVERRRVAKENKKTRDLRSVKVGRGARCGECVDKAARCAACSMFLERDVAVARKQALQAQGWCRTVVGEGGSAFSQVSSGDVGSPSVAATAPSSGVSSSLLASDVSANSSVSRRGVREVEEVKFREMQCQLIAMKKVVEHYDGEVMYLREFDRAQDIDDETKGNGGYSCSKEEMEVSDGDDSCGDDGWW